MKYHTIFVATGFAIGVGLGDGTLGIASSLLWWGGAVGAGALAWLFRRSRRASRASLFLALVALGAIRGGVVPSFPDWLLLRASGLREMMGTVVT